MLCQGQFRKSYSGPGQIVGATKWCVFRSLEPTLEVVEAAVQERLDRMQAPYVDLLQVIGVLRVDLRDILIELLTPRSSIGRITRTSVT